MNLRISHEQLRFRLSLAEAQQLHNEKLITDKIKLPDGGWLEYGVEIHDGLTQAEFLGSSLLFKIGPFDLQEIARGEEIIFSSQIKDAEIIIVVEVDRMSRKTKK
jgi:hypothetical protein